MTHNIIRTNIPEHLQKLPYIPRRIYRKYRPGLKNPDPLLDICSRVVDRLPLPECWWWSTEDVVHWVERDLPHLSEYKEAFARNFINGNTLVLVESDKLPRISIKKFDVIKQFTEAIRGLYKVDQDEFKRSISLPIRRPETLYIWYRAKNNGPTAFFKTRSQFLRDIHVIQDETTWETRWNTIDNHWNNIITYMPLVPYTRIGKIRRICPETKTTMKQNLYPKKKGRLHDMCIYHLIDGVQYYPERKIPPFEEERPCQNLKPISVKCN